MHRFAIVLVLIGSTGTASAQYLLGELTMAAESVETYSDDLTLGPFVDVYHLSVYNPYENPVTTIDLSLSGNWLNNNPTSSSAFNNGTELPSMGDYTFADSFFVTPDGYEANDILAVNLNDTVSELTAAFTIPRNVPLVPAGGSATLAVLSVESGTNISTDFFFGESVVNGSLMPIDFTGDLFQEPVQPEPKIELPPVVDPPTEIPPVIVGEFIPAPEVEPVEIVPEVFPEIDLTEILIPTNFPTYASINDLIIPDIVTPDLTSWTIGTIDLPTITGDYFVDFEPIDFEIGITNHQVRTFDIDSLVKPITLTVHDLGLASYASTMSFSTTNQLRSSFAAVSTLTEVPEPTSVVLICLALISCRGRFKI